MQADMSQGSRSGRLVGKAARFLATALAAMLVAAACGGDDSTAPTEAGQTQTGETEAGQPDIDETANDADDTQDDEAGEAADTREDTGAGGGSIVIAGIIYTFDADLCFQDPGFVQISGPGLRADGTPVYGSISVGTNEDYDGDGEPDVSGTVSLAIGTDSPFDGAPDDMADYEATLLQAGQLQIEEFTYEFRGDELWGEGEITDFNGVETGFGEYVSLVFTGICI